MNITGLVVEYNPLHKGHVYHINKTKELTNCDGIVCIMSGNFAQRGIPSIIDKWTKTKMALENGIDLVLELPTLYSVSSAEFFSFGAISLLNSLGIVNNICFGSESGNIDALINIASVLNDEPQEFKHLLKKHLDLGLLYPKSRSNALCDYFINKEKNIYKDNSSITDILNSANNILGIEYCKSLIKLKSNITPFTIKREGSDYNSTNLNDIFSSATSIRKYLKENTDVNNLTHHLPTSVFNIILDLYKNNYPFVFEDYMLPYLKHKSYTYKNSLENIPDVSEGIHNKIYKSLQKDLTYHDIVGDIKSKRYTFTRISRILCQYFIGFDFYDTKELRSRPCPYARVLGFNSTGKQILKSIKPNTNIPIYTKLPNNPNDVLSLDLQATRAYSILNSNINCNADYLLSPIIHN